MLKTKRTNYYEKIGRALFFETTLLSMSPQPAQVRLFHGTTSLTLMAAPFPAWPGSRRQFAWDPTINTTYDYSGSAPSFLGKEFCLAI